MTFNAHTPEAESNLTASELEAEAAQREHQRSEFSEPSQGASLEDQVISLAARIQDVNLPEKAEKLLVEKATPQFTDNWCIEGARVKLTRGYGDWSHVIQAICYPDGRVYVLELNSHGATREGRKPLADGTPRLFDVYSIDGIAKMHSVGEARSYCANYRGVLRAVADLEAQATIDGYLGDIDIEDMHGNPAKVAVEDVLDEVDEMASLMEAAPGS
jgi:hypothetical protein